MSKHKEFESNGQKYIFQRPPLSEVGRIADAAKRNGRIVPVRYYKLIMDNVIVSPKTSFKFFDEIEPNKEQVFQLNDVEYTFVYPGAKKFAEIEFEMLDDQDNPSEAKIHEQLLKHIIRVDGKPVDFEFFEELDDPTEFFDVIDAAADFFRNNEFKKVMIAATAFFRGKKI